MATIEIKAVETRKIIKWLTIAQIVSLIILPFIGTKVGDYYINGKSLAWKVVEGSLFIMRDTGWLWAIFMIAAPAVMHFTKEINNFGSWLVRVVANLLSFIGSIILLFVWTKSPSDFAAELAKKASEGCEQLENFAEIALGSLESATLVGTWVYMIVSVLLCAILVLDGKDYLKK